MVSPELQQQFDDLNTGRAIFSHLSGAYIAALGGALAIVESFEAAKDIVQNDTARSFVLNALIAGVGAVSATYGRRKYERSSDESQQITTAYNTALQSEVTQLEV